VLIAVVRVARKIITKGDDERREASRKAVVTDVKKAKESVTARSKSDGLQGIHIA